VLYVDTGRAHRHGVRFQRNLTKSLWFSGPVPLTDVLNLRPNFAVQLSAGGIPMVDGPDGVPRLALIKVTRRSGITWEVAKGKLEDGETPERAAIREVKEEMGLEVGLEIERWAGLVRYGFMAPGNRPRLKSVFLYLMRPTDVIPEGSFHPSEREGIHDVQWFTPDEAAEAVTHTSLQPVMRDVRDMLRA
jgi:8-oxo-dGTP pyrophosphatase MutT (NUDIX family)